MTKVSIDVQDELARDFEPSPLPPPGPDGALELPAMHKVPPRPPRLCEAGPCRHYHTFQIQLDAQKPMPVRRPDGSTDHAATPDHVETHHYCYPTVGVEMKLGALPVLQCNLWDPIPAAEVKQHDDAIEAWLKTETGQTFERDLTDWRTANDELAAELDQAALEAAQDLSEMPQPTCRLSLVELEPAEAIRRSGLVDPGPGFSYTVPWSRELADLRAEFIRWRRPDEDPATYLVGIATGTDYASARTLDPALTISQAGLSPGDRLVFTKRPLTTDPKEP
jgi:hypothetical protein